MRGEAPFFVRMRFHLSISPLHRSGENKESDIRARIRGGGERLYSSAGTTLPPDYLVLVRRLGVRVSASELPISLLAFQCHTPSRLPIAFFFCQRKLDFAF